MIWKVRKNFHFFVFGTKKIRNFISFSTVFSKFLYDDYFGKAMDPASKEANKPHT